MSTPPTQPRLVVAAGLVWLSPARVLLQRRSEAAAHGAGQLEFPGGKVERGESPAAALARELEEEWGPATRDLMAGPIAELLHHVYPAPGPEVLLCVYHVDGCAWCEDRWRARIQLEPGVRVEEHLVAELPLDEFLDADRPFAEAIAEGTVTPPSTPPRDPSRPATHR